MTLFELVNSVHNFNSMESDLNEEVAFEILIRDEVDHNAV
jgi:hypothetical protein